LILEAVQQTTKIPVKSQKDQLNTAFTTIPGHDNGCTDNESAAHEVALDEQYVFMATDDTPQVVLDHMLHISQQSEGILYL
jgi:CTP:molybdopterin cytidylyltransferase MocA